MMPLFSAVLFHWGMDFWLLVFSCSILRKVLWPVEQRKIFIPSLVVFCGGVNLLFIVLLSGPELFVLELNVQRQN